MLPPPYPTLARTDKVEVKSRKDWSGIAQARTPFPERPSSQTKVLPSLSQTTSDRDRRCAKLPGDTGLGHKPKGRLFFTFSTRFFTTPFSHIVARGDNDWICELTLIDLFECLLQAALDAVAHFMNVRLVGD